MDQLVLDPEVQQRARILLAYLCERVSWTVALYAAVGVLVCVFVLRVLSLCTVILLAGLYITAFLLSLIVSSPMWFFILLDCTLFFPCASYLLHYGIYTPLIFVEKYDIYSRGLVFTFQMLAILCLNVLLLDVYTYGQHYSTIEISLWSLKTNLFSLLIDYNSVIFILFSVLIFVTGFFLMLSTVFTDHLRTLTSDRLQAILLLLGILSIWCCCNFVMILVQDLLDAGTFTLLEAFLRRFVFLPTAIVLAMLVVLYWNCDIEECWWVFRGSHRRYSRRLPKPTDLLLPLFVLVFLTIAVTVLVHGPAASHSHGRTETVPSAPTVDTPVLVNPTYSYPSTNTPSQPPITQPPPLNADKCVQIDRNSADSIKKSHMVVLHYLDRNKKRRKLGILREIAVEWKHLADILGSNAKLILSSYAGGSDIPINCCRDMLYEWFDRGGVESYPLSWNGLIRALQDVELNRVADEIEEALQCVLAD